MGCVCAGCKLLEVHGVRLAVMNIVTLGCVVTLESSPGTSSLSLERYEGGCIKEKLAMPVHLRWYFIRRAPCCPREEVAYFS
jgi:hypothetical protein